MPDYDIVFEYLKSKPGPWRTYPNPMRDDGVFVGQDKSIEPYPEARGLHGEFFYPAVPQDAFCYPVQVPHYMAGRLVAELNKCETE